jgi:hypothetical protein
MVLAPVLVAVAAPKMGFLHIRTNLSRSSDRDSSFPEMDVSPDGNWVAVVWVEEYIEGDKDKGSVYLRAASEMGGGWGDRLSVFTAYSSAKAYDAAVAVAGSTAHVIYVMRDSSHFRVRYTTCALNTGNCTFRSEVTSTDAYEITWVDVALDGNARPHAVWAQYDFGGTNGRIWYKAYNGTTWVEEKEVSAGVGNNAPAIAWASDYAHVVWQVGPDTNAIKYRRRHTAVTGGWDSTTLTPFPGGILFPTGTPDVAAWGDRVFVVWDWCYDTQLIPWNDPNPCDTYNVVYRRSNDKGATGFELERSVGDTTFVQPYYSLDFQSTEAYLRTLQPSVDVNDDGWPTVVWHADRSSGHDGSDYAVYYNCAISSTATNVLSWTVAGTGAVLNQYQPSMVSAPAVGVVGSGQDSLLHVAYMSQQYEGEAWDVFYDTNADASGYSYVYLPLIMRSFGIEP